MYTERAKFEFFEEISQSARLAFLAQLASELEASRAENFASTNPGFSIEVKGNGLVTVDIWHPWKANVLWADIRRGQTAGLYRVTSPKEFS